MSTVSVPCKRSGRLDDLLQLFVGNDGMCIIDFCDNTLETISNKGLFWT